MGPLKVADDFIISRTVRVANHAAALTSLAYFGLVSSTMAVPKMQMPMATLASVITRKVGSTTNAQFANYFSTLVTPASFVFLIWPVIAALQSLALGASILRPGLRANPQSSLAALNTIARGQAMSQTELASLSLANVAATAWLFVSSNAMPGSLSLASFLVLPLVPVFAGYPLRNTNMQAPNKFVFQVFSSFTTIASCLALCVELQYGGRVPFLAGRAEACACVFLALVGGLVSLPGRSLARRGVTTLALSGVVARRLASGVGTATLMLSPSFLGAVALLAWSVKRLAGGNVNTEAPPSGFAWGITR